MSRKSALETLARRDPLTEQDWLDLISSARVMLEEPLRRMTLKSLGELKFYRDYFHHHGLVRDKDRLTFTGDKKFSLETRGVFPIDRHRLYGVGDEIVTSIERHRTRESAARAQIGTIPCQSETHRFWGLTRNSEWISVEVHVTRGQEPYKYEGRTEEVARARTVCIQEVTPPELLQFAKCKPDQIWEELRATSLQWVKHRRRLLEQAEQLERAFEMEETLIKFIQ